MNKSKLFSHSTTSSTNLISKQRSQYPHFVLAPMTEEQQYTPHPPSTYVVDRSQTSSKTHPQERVDTSYRQHPSDRPSIPLEFLSEDNVREHRPRNVPSRITRKRQRRIKVPDLPSVMEDDVIVPYHRILGRALHLLRPERDLVIW